MYGFDGELPAEYAANGAAGAPQKQYGYRDGQLLIVAEAGGGGSSSPNVTWTNAVGISVAANNLTKTAGDDWSNARASSTQAINSGNGYVEFTASETTTYRMLGLGEFDERSDACNGRCASRPNPTQRLRGEPNRASSER